MLFIIYKKQQSKWMWTFFVYSVLSGVEIYSFILKFFLCFFINKSHVLEVNWKQNLQIDLEIIEYVLHLAAGFQSMPRAGPQRF